MLFSRRKNLQLTEPLQLSTVSSRFESARPLYGTRNAQGFEARDKKTGESVVLWTLRFPLAPVSQEAALVLGHLRKAQSCVGADNLLNYGIDRNGTVFYTSPRHKGTTLAREILTPEQLPVVFSQMLEKIALLHQQGLVLGTLCEDSFLISPRFEVNLISFFPTVLEIERAANLQLSEGELSCLAPELRSGQPARKASDVYSLGALLYKLIGQRYLPGTFTYAQHAAHTRSYASSVFQGERAQLAWLRELFEKSLEWRETDRLKDAAAMVELLQQTKPRIEQRAAAKIRRLEADATAYLLSPITRNTIVALICVLTFAILYHRAEQRGILQEWKGREVIGDTRLTLSTSADHRADVRQVSALSKNESPGTAGPADSYSAYENYDKISWGDRIGFGRQGVLSGTDPNALHAAESKEQSSNLQAAPEPQERVPGIRPARKNPSREYTENRVLNVSYPTEQNTSLIVASEVPQRIPGIRNNGKQPAAGRKKQERVIAEKQQDKSTLEALILTGRILDRPWCPLP